jgi:hypothetical protein
MPSMTKKHFIALADAVRQNKPAGSMGGQSAFAEGHDKGRLAHWGRMVEVLADFCQSQSPKFDRERWLRYVSGEGGKNGGEVGTNGRRKAAGLVRHMLHVHSLHDANLSCSCGLWTLVRAGSMELAEAKREHRLHISSRQLRGEVTK